MTLYGRPENVILTRSIKFITTTIVKYRLSVPPGTNNNFASTISHKFWRDVPRCPNCDPKSRLCGAKF